MTKEDSIYGTRIGFKPIRVKTENLTSVPFLLAAHLLCVLTAPALGLPIGPRPAVVSVGLTTHGPQLVNCSLRSAVFFCLLVSLPV